MKAIMNFTIELPEGTTNHGDPNLICTPATWRDIFVFFVTNYFIHAATLPPVPGESKREIVFSVITALFIPGYGAARTLRRFILRPGFKHRKSPLQCALKAGALCMVVDERSLSRQTHGIYADPDGWAAKIFNFDLQEALCPSSRAIHGVFQLPEGYYLCTVPSLSKLRPTASSIPGSELFRPASEYNVVRILFSLVQAMAGGITIYRAQGDQITRYGYSAFGLSVVPYVFMSIMNLLASLLGPEYAAMYLVRTPDMDKAEKDGGKFEGIVAELVVRTPGSEEPKIGYSLANAGSRAYVLVWSFLVIAPLIIVGALSRFINGESSTAFDRGWILSWLVVGSTSSCLALWMSGMIQAITIPITQDKARDITSNIVVCLVFLIFMLPAWVPAIGGMVVVGRQLREYGICTNFDS